MLKNLKETKGKLKMIHQTAKQQTTAMMLKNELNNVVSRDSEEEGEGREDPQISTIKEQLSSIKKDRTSVSRDRSKSRKGKKKSAKSKIKITIQQPNM